MIDFGPSPNWFNSVIKYAVLFLIFALTACGGNGGGEPTARESSSGALAFKAVWPQPARDMAASTEGTPDVCAAFGIETITALVVDESGTQRGTGNWPCDTENHRGTIGGIPAGGGYRVMVQGLVAGDVLAWHGQAADITIEAGQTTTIDKITMHSLDFILHASCSDGGRIEPAGNIPASAISVQTFAFIPRSGYEIDDVIIDGTSQGYMESHTFSNLDADHTIYVSFTPTGTTTATHTITASAGGGGTIVPDGPMEVIEGNDQTFTFLPATGNHVADVFVDGVSQGPSPDHTFRDVDADHTIRVAFDTTTYTIDASAGPGGSIDPAGMVTADYGSTPAFTLAADAGFYLADLRVNGAAVLPQNAYTFQPVTDDATIEAVFKPVLYVDAGAPAGGNGATWLSAFQNLPDAIQAADDGDEIWIREGTYPLTGQVVVSKAVAIYGGHTGSELFAHERNWQDNPAIFDGQNQTRAFFVSADARIEGLIVQNGTPPSGSQRVEGGGMFIDNSSPTIVNCIFRNNSFVAVSTSGGGVYAENSSPIFQNCRFENNSIGGEGSGGGAMTLSTCTTTISGCAFIGNQVDGGLGGSGGCLSIIGGTAVITNSQFISNLMAGYFSGLGGAIFSKGADLTISESLFKQNISTSQDERCSGGAIHHDGTDAAANPVIRNSIFLDNSAGRDDDSGLAQGGALFNENADPTILNCTFSGNRTHAGFASRGGAIANESGSPTITNTILWGNHAYIHTGSTTSDGQGMQLYDDATSGSTVSYCVVDGPVPNGGDNLSQAPKLDAFGHLLPNSIGLDAGDDAAAPSTDIDGEARPQNGRSDIGADELVDGDGDRMPDYWELRYGLNIDLDDSAEDPDGDGLSNLAEYRVGLNPKASNPSVVALERGWYDELGFHDSSDDSTLCGKHNDDEHRTYFIFDLPAVSGTVVAAALRLELARFESIETDESFSVHDVTSDPDDLEASGSGQSAIFDDLGDGATYAGSVSITPAEVGQIVGVTLSPQAVSDINAALGGRFAVGLKSTSTDDAINDYFTFSETSETRTHQLVLVVE